MKGDSENEIQKRTRQKNERTTRKTNWKKVFKSTWRNQTLKCISPITLSDGTSVSCKQCIACRLNKAKEWGRRMTHEMREWKNSIHLILTYAENYLPENMSLKLEDIQLFNKRIRIRRKNKIKIFYCGEYGEKNGRPHYHEIIYGIGIDDPIFVGKMKSIKTPGAFDCFCKHWQYGTCTIKNVYPETCEYVAGYILKKVSGKKKQEYLDKGLEPPFGHMSKGIGLEWINNSFNIKMIKQNGGLKERGQMVGMPRYYRDKIWDKLTQEEKDLYYINNAPRETKPIEISRLAQQATAETWIPAWEKAMEEHKEMRKAKMEKIKKDKKDRNF